MVSDGGVSWLREGGEYCVDFFNKEVGEVSCKDFRMCVGWEYRGCGFVEEFVGNLEHLWFGDESVVVFRFGLLSVHVIGFGCRFKGLFMHGQERLVF